MKDFENIPDRRKCNVSNYTLDGARAIVPPWCKFQIQMVVRIEKDKWELQQEEEEEEDQIVKHHMFWQHLAVFLNSLMAVLIT